MTAAPEPLVRRVWTVDEVEALAAKYRTWGRWGADDELGAANYLTPDKVAAALAIPKRGAVFHLSLPLDRTGPMNGLGGRNNPQHLMMRHGGDVAIKPGPPGVDFTDDMILMPLQSSTQWDALSHVFYKGRMYNDRGTASVDSNGAKHNSVTALLERSVGRGVLLDIPRWLGRDWLEPGDAIQAVDLERCAAAQGVEVRSGDFLLIRTGHMLKHRAAGNWGDYFGGPAPGLGISAAEFICPREVVAVITDTAVGDAIPYETEQPRIPLHVVLLVNAGMCLGEMWDLERLAADCAEDGRYEFLLVAPPLNVTGAVGSPVTPIAIK
jgi:kynurenine formamidase